MHPSSFHHTSITNGVETFSSLVDHSLPCATVDFALLVLPDSSIAEGSARVDNCEPAVVATIIANISL
jgi:hypothetical protein